MASIEKVLFPVDFSPSCVAMAAHVKRAAAVLNAKVTLIHVVDPASFNALEMYMRSPGEVSDDHLEAARERLERFLHAEFPPAEYPRMVTTGDAAREIAAAAREGFGLIMMPSHSGIFRRMLLGSTAAKVLNDADCPVTTSRHAETFVPRPLEHREWVCALGLGETSERVLRYAYRLAMENGAHLRILHAIRPPEGAAAVVDLDLLDEVQAEEKKRVRERIDALQQKVGTEARVDVVVGPIKEALLEGARRAEADQLIIGRNPVRGGEGRLRDLTYAMVRDAPCPVTSV